MAPCLHLQAWSSGSVPALPPPRSAPLKLDGGAGEAPLAPKAVAEGAGLVITELWLPSGLVTHPAPSAQFLSSVLEWILGLGACAGSLGKGESPGGPPTFCARLL